MRSSTDKNTDMNARPRRGRELQIHTTIKDNFKHPPRVQPASVRMEWKSTVDAKSNRTYYSNARTKETTWTKPLDLCEGAEREHRLQRWEDDVRFFKDMEATIRKKMNGDECYHNEAVASLGTDFEINVGDNEKEMSAIERDPEDHRKPPIYRTISTLEDHLLELSGPDRRSFIYDMSSGPDTLSFDSSPSTSLHGEDKSHYVSSGPDRASFDSSPSTSLHGEDKSHYVKRESSSSYNTSSRRSTYQDNVNRQTFRQSREFDKAESKAKREEKKSLKLRKRRNSTGTLYIDSIMSRQDDSAVIKCLCIIIRTHMMKSVESNITPSEEFSVFQDENIHTLDPSSYSDAKQTAENVYSSVPSLEAIMNYFNYIFKKAMMESECIIMTLIYIERLFIATTGRLTMRYDNWKSILFACMIMASKVWDDLSMWNTDFAQVSPAFDLRRVNILEETILKALQFEVKVGAGEYAKYYFHMRGVMSMFGLSQEEISSMKPLDKKAAKKLKFKEEAWGKINKSPDHPKRIQSYTDIVSLLDQTRVSTSKKEQQNPRAIANPSVALEHILHSDHRDADGVIRTPFHDHSHSTSNRQRRARDRLMSNSFNPDDMSSMTSSRTASTLDSIGEAKQAPSTRRRREFTFARASEPIL